MRIDPALIDFDGWEKIEGLTGKSMGWFMAEFRNGMGNLKASDMKIIAQVAAARFDPSFSMEQAGKLTMGDLGGSSDPKESADDSTP